MSLLLIVVVVVEIIVFELHNIRRPLQACWSCRCGASGDAGSPASPRIHSAGNQDIAENSFYTVHLPVITVLDESVYIQCPGSVTKLSPCETLVEAVVVFDNFGVHCPPHRVKKYCNKYRNVYYVLDLWGIKIYLIWFLLMKWWMPQIGEVCFIFLRDKGYFIKTYQDKLTSPSTNIY